MYDWDDYEGYSAEERTRERVLTYKAYGGVLAALLGLAAILHLLGR